jgi:hypothetical protein
MNDLRQAAEMALNYFEDARGLEDTEVAIKEALRQALAEEALDRMVAENQRLGLYDDGPAVKTYCTPEVTPKVTPEVDNTYTKLDTTAGVLHKEWVGLTDCAACKKKDELIKLLKEEVGFAERGYTKRNDV